MMNCVHSGSRPTVELLYFDGCPNYLDYLPRLRRLLASAGLTDGLALRPIDSDQEAGAQRFLGSPSVRVDGQDVEPDAVERRDYGLQCRLYRTGCGLTGFPPDDWVLEALARCAKVA